MPRSTDFLIFSPNLEEAEKHVNDFREISHLIGAHFYNDDDKTYKEYKVISLWKKYQEETRKSEENQVEDDDERWDDTGREDIIFWINTKTRVIENDHLRIRDDLYTSRLFQVGISEVVYDRLLYDIMIEYFKINPNYFLWFGEPDPLISKERFYQTVGGGYFPQWAYSDFNK